MKKIIVLISLLVSVQTFAGEKLCIKAADYADTKIELCYNSYDLESSGLQSVSSGKTISVELLENSQLIGYFSAKLTSVDSLYSNNCNTLDIHTSYTLKVKGLNQAYQFGHHRAPRCKEGFSTSIFLFPVEKLKTAHLTAPFTFSCTTEKGKSLSIKLSKNGGAVIAKNGSNNFFFNNLKGKWKKQSEGVFHISAKGLPMKDLWDEVSATAMLKVSPLGSFAYGSYKSGTQNSGFKKETIECVVR